jgi:hypothetical protein
MTANRDSEHALGGHRARRAALASTDARLVGWAHRRRTQHEGPRPARTAAVRRREPKTVDQVERSRRLVRGV